ncbi:MAG: hypothetical protein J7501_17090, partial [Bdellovibrio sp.]|nr:hypothetical protein [Bdellovibrio sp.]
ASNFDKSFHVLVGNFSPFQKGHAFSIEDGEVTVKLTFRGNRDPKDKILTAQDIAMKIRQECQMPANFKGKGIKGVDSASSVPEPVSTNDNSIIVTMTFSVRAIFDLGK